MKSWKDDARVSVNPIFNDNKLKLGTFGTNGGGVAMTLAKEVEKVRWKDVEDAAIAADKHGIEAIVPFARWKGYVEDDPMHRTGVAFDCYTWAAGQAALTKTPAVFATSHVPTIHPLLAAKQCSTIDHISTGRFGLNVVAGWNKPELDMFGAPMKEHVDRYQQAGEWIDIVKRLWTAEDAFDYEGKFYRLTKAVSLPQPVQAHLPPIMNAGTSELGRDFAAKYADVAFVLLSSDDPDQIKAQVKAFREIARTKYDRDIQIWSYGYVIQRDTEKEAEDYFNYYVVQNGDEKAVDGWSHLQGLHAHIMPADQLALLKNRFKAGSGGFPLVGTPETIVRNLAMLSDCGIDGMLLSWLEYADGINRLARDVLPLMVQAGLRKGTAS